MAILSRKSKSYSIGAQGEGFRTIMAERTTRRGDDSVWRVACEDEVERSEACQKMHLHVVRVHQRLEKMLPVVFIFADEIT